MSMADAERDRIRRDCQDLLLKLARLTDHGPHDQIPALFTDDGEFDRDGAVVRGREALHDMYAKRPVSLMTRHLVSNLQVEPLSETEAVARSSATVYRFRSDDGTRPVPPVTCTGPEAVSEYEDRLVKSSDGWRLRRRILRTVIYVKPLSSG